MRLSILISCYRKTDYFVRTLDSFLNCGYHFRDTEMILCDDGSPVGGDGDTARRYAARFPQLIRVLRNPVNRGIAYSYQRMTDEARGDYLMPFDCDDILVPFDLDGAMRFLDEHPEYAASYGKKRLFHTVRGDLGENHGGDHSILAMAFNPRTVHNGMLIRTSDLRESGGYVPRFCRGQLLPAGPDVLMWAGLALRKRFYFDPVYRAFFRIHEQQHTAATTRLYGEAYRMLQRLLAEAYPDLWDGIVNRREMKIARDRIPAAQMLIGARMMQDSGENLPHHLRQAEYLIPDDYAIREYRARHLLRNGKYPEALSEAFLLSAEHPGCPYIQSLAMGFAEEAALPLGLDAAPYRRRGQQLSAEMFFLTDRQKQLLDSLASAR